MEEPRGRSTKGQQYLKKRGKGQGTATQTEKEENREKKKRPKEGGGGPDEAFVQTVRSAWNQANQGRRKVAPETGTLRGRQKAQTQLGKPYESGQSAEVRGKTPRNLSQRRVWYTTLNQKADRWIQVHHEAGVRLGGEKKSKKEQGSTGGAHQGKKSYLSGILRKGGARLEVDHEKVSWAIPPLKRDGETPWLKGDPKGENEQGILLREKVSEKG